MKKEKTGWSRVSPADETNIARANTPNFVVLITDNPSSLGLKNCPMTPPLLDRMASVPHHCTTQACRGNQPDGRVGPQPRQPAARRKLARFPLKPSARPP